MSRHFCLGVALTLLTALTAIAQYSQLAATDDGKQVYFISSQVLQGKDRDNREPRLYRAAPDGVTLFVERGDLAAEGSLGTGEGVESPSVSGDGSLVVVTLKYMCQTAPDCNDANDLVVLRGSRSLDLGPGVAQISRNGKWATIATGESPSNPDPLAPGITTRTLIDLRSGARQKIISAVDDGVSYSLRSLASDGSVLVFLPDPVQGRFITGTFGIWKNGKITPLNLPADFDGSRAVLSDDASTLTGAMPSSKYKYSDSLEAIYVASGRRSTIFQPTAPLQRPIVTGVMNNGQRVLYTVTDGYTSNGPAFVWDAVTGVSIPVPLRSGELANGGTMSGNGEIAFVATTSGRIVKFVVATGNATSLFPEPPHCDDPGPLAYGSLARLRNCTFSGTVADLQHHVFYDWLEAPVLYVKPDEIGVYLPVYKDFFWHDTLSIDLPTQSPFQSDQPLQIADAAPAMLPADPSTGSLFGIQMIKGDFSGYVTRTPLPGDIIHMYMIGLGPVDEKNANRMKWKLACRFQQDGPAVQPLFAGLAPGLLGVYQTTFIVPAGNGPVTTTALSCDVTSPNGLLVTVAPGSRVFGMIGTGFVFSVP